MTESSARAISELLTSVRAERDNLQGQVKRMEATLNYFEQLSSSQSQKVAVRRNELAQYVCQIVFLWAALLCFHLTYTNLKMLGFFFFQVSIFLY